MTISADALHALIQASGHTEDDARKIAAELERWGYTIVSAAWVRTVRENALNQLAAEAQALGEYE